MPRPDLHLEFLDLPVQFFEMGAQSFNQLAKHARQLVLSILQNFRQPCLDVANSLRNGDAEFSQQSADLIGLRRSGFNETLSSTVYRQKRLLLGMFH